MLDMHYDDTEQLAEMRSSVLAEREKSLSKREWKHRMLGLGYAVTDTETGQLVTRLATSQTVFLEA